MNNTSVNFEESRFVSSAYITIKIYMEVLNEEESCFATA